MALLSPGVEIVEIDASGIVPTVSNSVGVFCGKFNKGPVESFLLITNEKELVQYYGMPTNLNYNDWYQAASFLKYGNKLLVARATDTTLEPYLDTDAVTTTSGILVGGETSFNVQVGLGTSFNVGDLVAFDIDADLDADYDKVYEITAISSDTITVAKALPALPDGTNVFIATSAFNAGGVAVQVGGSEGEYDFELVKNANDFEEQNSLSNLNKAQHLQFIARDPGEWGQDIEIAIGNPSDFTNDYYAIPDVKLTDLFEYYPVADDKEVAIVITYAGEVVETFLVSLDPAAKDYNNKSSYIESVINSQSSYVFVTDGTDGTVESYVAGAFDISGTGGLDSSLIASYGTVANGDTKLIKFIRGIDSQTTNASLLTAYELFDNKEELDVDIIIANESDGGVSAKALTDARQDCICFIGANYSDVVGKKAAIAVNNLVAWRQSGAINYNNMFTVACANYVYVYDRYNDKNRWINVAGHIAGLRAQTSTNRASWYENCQLAA